MFRKLSPQMRTILRGAGLLFGVFLLGMVGFRWFAEPGQGWIHALYMTAITLTTVGYGETVPVSHHPAGMLFTAVLLLVGVSTFIYFFSHLTAFVVEGGLDRLIWRRKMNAIIEGMRDHVVLCGGGNTGRHAARELLDTERSFVVIDSDPAVIKALHAELGEGFGSVVGDATDDDVLRAAGIERAAGLVAVTSDDKNNLIVTVSARLLNPALRIVCRCHDRKVEDKIAKAGADAVVSPDYIGGLRLVSELIRPAVVTFLDVMMRDRHKRLRVENVEIGPGGNLAGKTVGELRRQLPQEALLLALAHSEKDWHYNPRNDLVLEPGRQVVFMGSPEVRAVLERELHG